MLSQVHQKDLFFPTKQYVILVKILCYKAIIKNKNKNKNKVNNENVVHSDIDIMKIWGIKKKQKKGKEKLRKKDTSFVNKKSTILTLILALM